jgi:hypothetical protein
MTDIENYRIALITLKNKIDTYKKNKLSVTIFSILLTFSLLAIATLLLLEYGLTNISFKSSPAIVAISSFAIMLGTIAFGYWLIFKNPNIDKKRQTLYESLVATLIDVSPHSDIYSVLVEDYKNKVIGEHALLNMVLAELRRTETL